MKKFITASLIVLAAAAMTACCPCRFARKNTKPFIETTWHLIQLAGQDLQLADNTFNITFRTDNMMSGIGSCNRFNAKYNVDMTKESLDIGVIASTRMLCADVATEQRLYTELDGATHYEIDGSTLILINNGEIRALFTAVENPEKN